jgi:hypothetical protein
MELSPARSDAHVEGTSKPAGVTAPSPVTDDAARSRAGLVEATESIADRRELRGIRRRDLAAEHLLQLEQQLDEVQ